MEVAFFTKKSKKDPPKYLVVSYHTCVRSSGDPCPPPPAVRLRISGMTSAAGLFLRVCACQGFRVKSAENKMLIIKGCHWELIKEALSNRARFWLACLTRMSTQNYHSKVTWFYWVRRQEGWVASGIEVVLTSHTIWLVGSAHRRKWGGWNACWIEVEQSLPHQKLRSPRHHWKK